jgi:hypothetical protein
MRIVKFTKFVFSISSLPPMLRTVGFGGALCITSDYSKEAPYVYTGMTILSLTISSVDWPLE